jgi:hypothetical protein
MAELKVGKLLCIQIAHYLVETVILSPAISAKLIHLCRNSKPSPLRLCPPAPLRP